MNWEGLLRVDSLDWMLVKAGDKFAAFDKFGIGGGWFTDPNSAFAALEEKKKQRREFLRKRGMRVRPHKGQPFNRTTKHHARRRV